MIAAASIPDAASGVLEQRPASEASPASLLRLLERLERLPGDAVGALCIEDPEGAPHASVLVENGRVCWAAVKGSPRRLREILIGASDPPPPADAFERIVRECKKTNEPFGEALVARGLVSRDALRRSLCAHTAEGMLAITAMRGVKARWIPHQRSRYDASFTFAPSEILAACAARWAPRTTVEAARGAVSRFDGISLGTAAYDADGPTPGVPIAISGSQPWSLEEARAMGKWAVMALGIFGSGTTPSRVVVARRDEETALVAYAELPVVVALVVEGRRDLVQVLLRCSEGFGGSEPEAR